MRKKIVYSVATLMLLGFVWLILAATSDLNGVKARDAWIITNFQQVQLALELYYDNNRAYPSAVGCSDLETLEQTLSPQYLATKFFEGYRNNLKRPHTFFERLYSQRPIIVYRYGVSEDRQTYVLTSFLPHDVMVLCFNHTHLSLL